MIIRLFKLIWRNARKHPAGSFINLFGLVLGITSTLFILEYVYYERSFETQYHDSGRIYRVVYNRYQENKLLWKTANSFYPAGEYLKETFPEVDGYFQLRRNYNIEISSRDAGGNRRSFFEGKTYYASPSIGKLLDIPLLQGTKECLDAPNSVIISERAAQKYFGNADPLGKEITVNSSDVFVITGIFRNMASNTHIKTDFLFSFEHIYTHDPWLKTNWFYDYNYTYIMLAPGTDYAAFARKAFPRMISENYGDYLKAVNQRDEFFLQPVRSIHLDSSIEYETEPPGNSKAISLLFGFSLFLLLIAWVNYINLSTARAVERARETGIKKVHGAYRGSLIFQYMIEALIFNTLCLVISILLVLALNPLFRDLTGIPDLNFPVQRSFIVTGILVFAGGVFLSGLYPAFVLSSFRPLMILKGNYKNTTGGIILRKGLVTLQFFISISLLIATGVIFNQVKFLMKKDPGFDASSVMIIRAPRTNETDSVYAGKILRLRDEMEKLPGIHGFTFTSDVPGQEINNWFSCYRKGYADNDMKDYFRTDIDRDFLGFFRIKLVEGRNFNAEDRSAQNKVLINLQAMDRLGFENPEKAVGQRVINGGHEFEIIGVTGDVNYYTIKIKAVPTFFTLADHNKSYMALKYDPSATDLPAMISSVRTVFTGIFPDNAFDDQFLDEKMALNLVPDKTFAMVFGVFSVLAIVIGIIGIIGLVMVIINQSMKELGVRKILGASLYDMNVLLSHQVLWPVIIATCLALPLSALIIQNRILGNYVYHISITWVHLVLPVIILVLIFAAVIALLAGRAYRINVSEVLKAE